MCFLHSRTRVGAACELCLVPNIIPLIGVVHCPVAPHRIRLESKLPSFVCGCHAPPGRGCEHSAGLTVALGVEIVTFVEDWECDPDGPESAAAVFEEGIDEIQRQVASGLATLTGDWNDVIEDVTIDTRTAQHCRTR